MAEMSFPGGRKAPRPRVTAELLRQRARELAQAQIEREYAAAEDAAGLKGAEDKRRDDNRRTVESGLAKMRKPVFRPDEPAPEEPIQVAQGPQAKLAPLEPENVLDSDAQVLGVTDDQGNPVDMSNILGQALTEVGKPKPQPAQAGQPAVNPYTGQPLRETEIFGGAGTISEAFATPSDNTFRFQNPYVQENLSPMQKSMAAAEIGAIQEAMTRSKRKAVWDMTKIDGEKVNRFLRDPNVPESAKAQVREQYTMAVEEAGKSGDLEHLFETAEAQDDPIVALAKQKAAFEHVISSRFKDKDFGHLIASLGDIDPKTGKPSFAAAMPLIAMRNAEYQEEQRAERENRTTKEGYLSNLRKLAEKAAVHVEEPAYTQSYLSARADFEERYAPLAGVKPVYAEGEFDLAAELKALSAAGRVQRPGKESADSPIEIDNEADFEALQDEVNRTGVPVDCIYNGQFGQMTPE